MSTIDEQRIREILSHYDELIDSIKGKSFEDIEKDKILLKAIKLDIYQIGEHIKNLNKPIQQMLNQNDVNNLIYIRNKLSHEYKKLEADRIKVALDVCIPKVVKQLNEILSKKKYLLK